MHLRRRLPALPVEDQHPRPARQPVPARGGARGAQPRAGHERPDEPGAECRRHGGVALPAERAPGVKMHMRYQFMYTT